MSTSYAKREKWGFKETVYCRSILRNITNCVFTDLNPFKSKALSFD